METFVVVSFWYLYMALRMHRVPAHSVIQKKCPLFDTFCSVSAEVLMYKVKFFCMVLGMALNAQNYAGVIVCMWLLFLFYENVLPCIRLCNLGKPLTIKRALLQITYSNN